MLFSRSSVIECDNLSISTVNGSSIVRVQEHKYLGMWLDDKTDYRHHISFCSTKWRQKPGFLNRNKARLPQPWRKWLWTEYLSVLDYGAVFYKNLTASNLWIQFVILPSTLLPVMSTATIISPCMRRLVGPPFERDMIGTGPYLSTKLLLVNIHPCLGNIV